MNEAAPDPGAIDVTAARLEKLEQGIALMFESERSIRNDQVGRLEDRLHDLARGLEQLEKKGESRVRLLSGDVDSIQETIASLRRSVGSARKTLAEEREAMRRDREVLATEATNAVSRIRSLEEELGELRELGILHDRRDDRQPDPAETPGRRQSDEPFGQSIQERSLLRREKRPNPRSFQEAPVELRMALDEAQAQEKEQDARRLEKDRDPWAHRSKGMRCATCMFFVPKAPDPTRAPPRSLEILGQGQLGRCRRHAPTMKGYPAVFETDWCGEHKIDENKL